MSITEPIKERMKSFAEELRKKKEELSAEFRKEMSSAFDAIFEAYPTLIGFTWTQYAPYFNDGDECTFSVNELKSIKFVGMEDWGEVEEYNECSYQQNPRARIDLNDKDKEENEANFPGVDLKTFKAICEELSIIYEIPDDIMEDLFGEGEIAITKGNIEVRDYDHN